MRLPSASPAMKTVKIALTEKTVFPMMGVNWRVQATS